LNIFLFFSSQYPANLELATPEKNELKQINDGWRPSFNQTVMRTTMRTIMRMTMNAVINTITCQIIKRIMATKALMQNENKTQRQKSTSIKTTE
jgi:hypothetical protein